VYHLTAKRKENSRHKKREGGAGVTIESGRHRDGEKGVGLMVNCRKTGGTEQPTGTDARGGPKVSQKEKGGWSKKSVEGPMYGQRERWVTHKRDQSHENLLTRVEKLRGKRLCGTQLKADLQVNTKSALNQTPIMY